MQLTLKLTDNSIKKIADLYAVFTKLNKILKNIDIPDTTIIWSGDFNFNFIEGKELDATLNSNMIKRY